MDVKTHLQNFFYGTHILDIETDQKISFRGMKLPYKLTPDIHVFLKDN